MLSWLTRQSLAHFWHTKADSAPLRSALIALAVVWLAINALVNGANHDESQYAAAAVLSRSLLIFRDFASLQPPMHAWAYMPIAALFPHDSYVAMRLATALCGAVTLLAIYLAQRLLLVCKPLALATTLLALSCKSFLFTASIIRNDMLPAMFASWAIVILLLARERTYPVFLTAATGLLMALAVATKLSYIPAAAMLALYLFAFSGHRTRAAASYGIGGVVGLLPTLAVVLIAPNNFLYGVVEFASTAPFAWYREAGMTDQLTVGGKLTSLASFLSRDAAGLATLIVIVAAVQTRLVDDRRKLVACLVVAGLLGAALPTPTHIQYLLPLIAPLFIALGLYWEGVRPGNWLVLLFAVVALVSLRPAMGQVRRAWLDGAEARLIDREANWIGKTMRKAGVRGFVTTLSPERAMGSGYPLDPRFATGPFVYRAGELLSSHRAADLKLIIPANLEAMLDREPPAAILTGYEGGWPKKADLEGALRLYAHSRGYVSHSTPDGRGLLFVAD